ncbi:hypothetical protein B0T22DRAFT_478022 [Podospora appendiculata]|uniref:HIT-type domain-containing protein n=1 Tax=Podospora appendiculata TaxID=314037 RepID=A0AAE1CIA0_9PEZI|nr:hypothetical protein B0T22DRAFT_478022 [Podospora appendiculata]
MNNFGVIEVASTKTKNAPGWAYVPDNGPSLAAAALQPANRKRAARNQTALSISDVSARQDTKIRKDLEALDRDIHKDANITIPPKPGASRAQNKHTPNVRKILQSQKTFANHLDDYQALLLQAETNPAMAAALLNAAQSKAATPTAVARGSPAPSASSASASATPAIRAPTSTTTTTTTTSKRSAALAKRAAAAAAKESREAAAAAAEKAAAEKAAAEKAAAEKAAAEEAAAKEAIKSEPEDPSSGNDVEMKDAPPTTETAETLSTATGTPEAAATQPQAYPADGTILPVYKKAPPTPHPGDTDSLLVSHVPPFPSDDELRALLTAPPLSYLEARAGWGDDEARYPVRMFCEVCGYWGRVRCIKCGARVCALDCLQAHREECVTRYGL